MSTEFSIVRAGRENSSAVARLFNRYRQFYECEDNLPLAEKFIRERIANDESVIFLAENAERRPLGFVQLYPSFCSVQAVKIMILYDLFVDVENRKTGVGEALMQQATDFAKEAGAVRLDLLTAKSNTVAQSLYTKLGYQRTNEDFIAFSLDV